MAKQIVLALIAALVFATAPLAADSGRNGGVVFHFYGAEDCPPCMAFKRDGLPAVEAAAATAGFRIEVNIIERTRDVPSDGAYGQSDTLLRSIAGQLRAVYPPIFFVTKNGVLHSLHDHDWRAALASAAEAAG